MRSTTALAVPPPCVTQMPSASQSPATWVDGPANELLSTANEKCPLNVSAMPTPASGGSSSVAQASDSGQCSSENGPVAIWWPSGWRSSSTARS